MTLARTLTGVWCLPLLLAACGGGGMDDHEERTVTGPRNVVLIVVDTLRKDHLGCYGYRYPTSPNIDALAGGGTRYLQALSQAPWTTPSIGSLLTSQYPSTLGIKDDRSILGDRHVSLAEVLRDHGFVTGAVVSHSFCSATWNFDQGFEFFDESNVLGHDGISSQGVSDRGIEFLEQHRDQRFFLWLHYFDPHFAFRHHAEHDVNPAIPYDGPVESGMRFKDLRRVTRGARPEDVAQIVRFYDSEIAYCDLHIGRLLDRLRTLDLYDETLIIFTADHGEEFYDHGLLGHARTLYNEVINVPLIVRIPGRGSAAVERPVALLDLFPTVLEALDISVTHSLAGTSLLAPPAEDAPVPAPIFSETSRTRELRGVVSGHHKLIVNLETGRQQLFDLAADPTETHDLLGAPPPELPILRRDLESWLERQRGLQAEAEEIELSPQEQARLEALGYVGDPASDEDER